jgi:hypothetical protein
MKWNTGGTYRSLSARFNYYPRPSFRVKPALVDIDRATGEFSCGDKIPNGFWDRFMLAVNPIEENVFVARVGLLLLVHQ